MNSLFTAAILFAMTSSGVQADRALSKEQIRIMAVARTPESNTVQLNIARPKKGEVIPGNPSWMQFRIGGYALGADSQFDRADEIANSNMGQTVHVIIDNLPYFPVNEPALNPFNENGYYYNTSYKFEIPYALKEGVHTIQVFPARSFGESLKGEGTYEVMYFYVGKEKESSEVDFSKPYLVYNEPSDHFVYREGKPVLLDFLVKNCELTPDGYKVRLTVDKKTNRTITTWQPYYIYGLTPGTHTIRLELLDEKNRVVSGSLTVMERSFSVN
jgi:hypothetical protein